MRLATVVLGSVGVHLSFGRAPSGPAAGPPSATEMQLGAPDTSSFYSQRIVVGETGLAIRAHAAARVATPPSEEYALFDQYALVLSRHQSDLFWMKEEGHRTPVFGELPGDGVSAPDGAPLGADPFADDPFAEDPFGGELPDSDASGGDPADAVPPAEPPSTDDAALETP